MIEDTTFIIDILNGDEGALARLDAIEGERQPEKVSSITVLELYEGVTRTQKPEKEREQVLSVLDSKAVVPADHGVMRRAGELSGELITDGQQIDREDCIVAATGLQEGEPVLTRNTAHFERIPGLEVVSY
jgi:tRNA(fMet)-specific endonuclease VapC